MEDLPAQTQLIQGNYRFGNHNYQFSVTKAWLDGQEEIAFASLPSQLPLVLGQVGQATYPQLSSWYSALEDQEYLAFKLARRKLKDVQEWGMTERDEIEVRGNGR